MRKYSKQLFLFLCFISFSSNGLFSQSAFPVVLSSPMDYDTITEMNPNLIWQTDIQRLLGDSRFTQRLEMFELLENQTKGDALVMNQPLLIQDNYQNTMFPYSSTTNPLQFGHSYVWRVVILYNGMQVDQSDIYQFTLYDPSLSEPNFYPVAFKNDGQTYLVENGKIGLVTDEPGNLDLALKLYLNGTLAQEVFLNEYQAGVLLTETTSPSGMAKRKFVLDVEQLNLQAGFYNAYWLLKSGKKYTFNFTVD